MPLAVYVIVWSNGKGGIMRHHVKVTVLDKKCFCDLQEAYLWGL